MFRTWGWSVLSLDLPWQVFLCWNWSISLLVWIGCFFLHNIGVINNISNITVMWAPSYTRLFIYIDSKGSWVFHSYFDMSCTVINCNRHLNLGCLHPVAYMRSRWGGFHLRNVITVGFTVYYSLHCYVFWSYAHLQAEIYLSEITLMTTDQLLLRW
jgi:hypothetical protein